MMTEKVTSATKNVTKPNVKTRNIVKKIVRTRINVMLLNATTAVINVLKPAKTEQRAVQLTTNAVINVKKDVAIKTLNEDGSPNEN